MVIDQSEINNLLAQAGMLDEGAPKPPPKPAAPPPRPVPTGSKASADVQRIMRIRVPIIVRLAQRRQSVSEIRRLSLGMMIEFERSVHEHLELLVNNRTIGRGEAVKSGDKFGLRVSEITSPIERVTSLGR